LKTKHLIFVFLFFQLYTARVYGNDTLPRTEVRELLIDTVEVVVNPFRENFKSDYSDGDYIYEPKMRELSWWERFWERILNWFRDLFNFGNSGRADIFTEWFFRIVAISIILLCMYLIAKSILNKEGQWIFGKNSDRKLMGYEDVEKNLMQTDFEKLIAETEAKGEIRLAIRYYYLYLLRKLAAREIIEWDVEKTNSDYFNEIKDPELKKAFGFVSYAYNYIWYGEFGIDEINYQRTRGAFIKLLKQL
jgi:hypothetical protein